MEKTNKLFSIKARSSRENIHISGGERLVFENEIEKVVNELLKKVNRNSPDFISIKIEEVKEEPIVLDKTLKIKEYKFKNFQEANEFAINLLHKKTSIPLNKLKELIDTIHSGASPDGTNMRGAMIVDTEGNRIELDKYRGIRTTSMDFINREKILSYAKSLGLTERTIDALAIATKNLNYPDFLAEYCISDEPDYITGYIALNNTYYRLTPLKNYGNTKGGRIYFVKKGIDIQNLYNYLEKTPVLIKELGI